MVFVKGRYSLPSDADAGSGQYEADKGGYQGFQAPMSIRMAVIRRAGPVVGAGDDGKIGGRIGEAVDGIGNYRLTLAGNAGCKFKTSKQNVYDQAKPGYLANICFP